MGPRVELVDLGGRDSYVISADNSLVLPLLPDAAFQLVYIDPPINTGKRQERPFIFIGDPALRQRGPGGLRGAQLRDRGA